MVNVFGDRKVGSIGAQGPPGYTEPPGSPALRVQNEARVILVKAGVMDFANGYRI